MKRLKKIPKFKDEDAEREFRSKADSTEYIDWSKAQKLVLPNFRPTLRTISLRLPESMIAELKLLANQRDVPYQSVRLASQVRPRDDERAGGQTVRRRRKAPLETTWTRH
jgi:predicted DNA binding CopG/RHH family protein